MMGGFGMFGGMFIFWILIIVLAVLLVKGLFNANESRSREDTTTAKQILDERYARGEINREQYNSMLKDIL
jgi:putative membrane protein